MKRRSITFLLIIAGVISFAFLIFIVYPKINQRATVSVPVKTDMDMVRVPAGNFLMGSEKSDRNQRPPHKVFLDAFWIDQTEVTNGQYQQCVKDGGCGTPHEADYFKDAKYSDHPVIYVSWDEALTFCIWAGKRLPTEAEWEKAARGDDGRTYPWGNRKPNAGLTNYLDNRKSSTAVSSYPAGASPYGAMDMAGNVWEWTADWYDPGYYKTSPVRNPQGSPTGDRRVVRGGSWFSLTEIVVRTYYRKASIPEAQNYTTGFRCVWSE
jgi:serine/threonine-protein kinase